MPPLQSIEQRASRAFRYCVFISITMYAPLTVVGFVGVALGNGSVAGRNALTMADEGLWVSGVLAAAGSAMILLGLD